MTSSYKNMITHGGATKSFNLLRLERPRIRRFEPWVKSSLCGIVAAMAENEFSCPQMTHKKSSTRANFEHFKFSDNDGNAVHFSVTTLNIFAKISLKLL